MINIMTPTPTIQATLLRYHAEIQQALRQALQRHSVNSLPTQGDDTTPFYGQMQYHLGWVDRNFAPIASKTGKLLRPTLLLLAYEAVGAWGLTDQMPANGSSHLHRALPAAAALELTHNFTLIHDDIVDQDIERHHRPTLWSIWGSSQGINTGDGMFSLGRLTLWDILDEGVTGEIAARLGMVLDRACLIISEGQYLDLSFEQRSNVSVAMYMGMIARKTAILMSSATEMGALLGTNEQATIERLRQFGLAIGIAFQVRDDVMSVWASASETGKTSAGDIYRRKKSLPILHALEHANKQDQQVLHSIYTQAQPPTAEQVATTLTIFEHTHTREYCLGFLGQQIATTRNILHSIPHLDNAIAARALDDMETLIRFLEIDVQE